MGKEAPVEKTLALIKPDAIRNGNEKNILQKIELNGFTIVTRSRIHLTPERAGEFYAEHKGKPFYGNLVNFMSSGPLMALVLAKNDAILGWRALMGPTNSHKAREEQPNSLRALFGTDGTCNATHGSDSVASACREIRFFFPKLVQDPLPDSNDAKKFVQQELQPTLVKCLTTLCKLKPTANKLEAITWVAKWLLDNNPNKPRPLDQAESGALEVEEEEDDMPMSEDEEEGGLDAMEEELAATRLQSHFRGYQTRKTMKAKASANAPKQSVVVHQVETTAEDEQAAAVKVQSLYRGHKARKTVKEKKAGAA